MEATMVKALFPVDSVRRGFLKAVGANTARAAIASLFPLGALEAMAQDKGPLEKKDLKIASSPSPVRRRSSWPTRWGFIKKKA